MAPVLTVPDSTGVDCQFCGRAFPTEDLRALHRGQEHADRLDQDERAAYEAAYEAETKALRRYRLNVVAALVVLYFGFLYAYALFG